MSATALVLCLTLMADDPSDVETSAAIERDTAKAQADVAAKYGNRQLSEMSSDERRQMAKDQAAAEKAVFEKAGVDPKEWSRQQARRSREDVTAQNEKRKELDAKAKAAAGKKKDDGPKEVQVQRGISEENPVTIDEKADDDGKVSVEKSLPPEVDADQAAAREQDGLEKSGDASDAPAKSAPSKGGRGGGRRK